MITTALVVIALLASLLLLLFLRNEQPKEDGLTIRVAKRIDAWRGDPTNAEKAACRAQGKGP